MTNDYLKYESVLEKGLKLINVINELERTPRSYGTEKIYYSLEIHTIHAIGKNNEMNVTEIADWHGISKSAVSKVLNKLEKKGALYKYKALNNKKEVLVGLTEEGKKAFQGHIQYHLEFQSKIFEKFNKVPYEKLKNFEEVVSIFIES